MWCQHGVSAKHTRAQQEWWYKGVKAWAGIQTRCEKKRERKNETQEHWTKQKKTNSIAEKQDKSNKKLYIIF